MSYQADVSEAVRNAGRMLKEGHVDSVKLEGGREMVATVRAIIAAGIAVMGHIGLTPQSLSKPVSYTHLVDDPEWLDLMTLEIGDVLQGTVLSGAPIVPVSARTGQGLDQLSQSLAQALSQLEPKTDRGQPLSLIHI